MHCASWPASGEIRGFHSQFSNPGKSENIALFEKIRDTSSDFIIDKGKKSRMIVFDFPENVL